MKNRYLFAPLFIFFLFTVHLANAQEIEYADYANPLMGTQSKFEFSNGNTYPAIGVPWGMNIWSPQTGRMGDGWMYTYTADKIRGFKQTHQPSPWMNDYGQFSLMAVTGSIRFDQDERASWFSHKSETVKPYYYQVFLADHTTNVEFSPTERSAIFRFTFPKTDTAAIIVDAFDKGSYVKVIPGENKVIGFSTRHSRGPLVNFHNYFVMEFSKPFAGSFTRMDTVESRDLEARGNHAMAALHFKTEKDEVIEVKVSSSFISHEQAERNLQQELAGKTFEQVKENGRKEWNDKLGRIKVEGGTDEQMRTFYSAMYRTLFFPHKMYELDASGAPIHYSPYTGETLPGRRFAGTGFWDTFRALYPFLNLVFPSINKEMQEGLTNDYLEGGWLPEWSSPAYANIMIGNNSASVVSEAWVKGLRGYDINKLYEALLHGANNAGPITAIGRAGVEYYNKLGYVPYDVKVHENAARTLEYAYNDFSIYQLAKLLNRPKEEIKLYATRSLNYKNLFDKETNLMRPKLENGQFLKDFEPLKWGDAFTEGNSWHYTWSVFHDVEGLAQLMGGKPAFVNMLDSVFSQPPYFDESGYGMVIHEIREMQVANMGQYAHGNQPIQHMIYLYNHGGAPWKAQYWVRETMNRMYSSAPDGYCGDEDNGQTSAWYVFSALGFYPVAPTVPEYVIGAPLFKKATIHLENGKTIRIHAPENSDENRYINWTNFNGKAYNNLYLNHFDLMNGADIRFGMSATPNTTRKYTQAQLPYSFSVTDEYRELFD